MEVESPLRTIGHPVAQPVGRHAVEGVAITDEVRG